MLTEAYIEALLVNEEIADRVWGLWQSGTIDDQLAFLAWMITAASSPSGDKLTDDNY